MAARSSICHFLLVNNTNIHSPSHSFPVTTQWQLCVCYVEGSVLGSFWWSYRTRQRPELQCGVFCGWCMNAARVSLFRLQQLMSCLLRRLHPRSCCTPVVLYLSAASILLVSTSDCLSCSHQELIFYAYIE